MKKFKTQNSKLKMTFRLCRNQIFAQKRYNNYDLKMFLKYFEF